MSVIWWCDAIHLYMYTMCENQWMMIRKKSCEACLLHVHANIAHSLANKKDMSCTIKFHKLFRGADDDDDDCRLVKFYKFFSFTAYSLTHMYV